MYVGPVAAQIVAAGCHSSEWSMPGGQGDVPVYRRGRLLYPWRAHGIRSFQPQVLYDALRLPRVGLVLETLWRPADDPVKNL